jgi:imidazolonepropionase
MPLFIKNASELVTVSGNSAKCGNAMQDIGVIHDGAIVMDDGIIIDVDTTENMLSKHDVSKYEVINASGKAVLPGFIDPHTHFVFGGYRVDEFIWRLQGESYMDIMKKGGGIASSTAHTRNESFEELYQKGYDRLNEFSRYGICLLYTSPSPRDRQKSRKPSTA